MDATAATTAPVRSHPFTRQPVTSRSRVPALLAGHTPLHVIPALVLLLRSVARAVVVQRLHYWLTHNAGSPDHQDAEGRAWVRFSYAQLAADLQHVWKAETVGGHVRALVRSGVLARVERKPGEFWYSVEHNRLEELAGQQSPDSACAPGAEELLEPRDTRLLYPVLARALGPGDAGVNRALLLHQVFFWSSVRGVEHAGLQWVERPVRTWRQDFPFLSVDAINSGLTYLADYGIVTRRKFSRHRRHTYSYAVNPRFLEGVLAAGQPAGTPATEPAPDLPGNGGGCTEPEKGRCTEPKKRGRTEPEINKEITGFETTPESSGTAPGAGTPEAPAAPTTLFQEKTVVLSGQQLIARQFRPAFLQLLYQEVPPRRGAWAALADSAVADCYRRAREAVTAASAEKKLGTIFRELLDAAAGLDSDPAARNHAAGAVAAGRDQAAQRRLGFADSCRNWVLDQHPGDDFDEHFAAAERVHAHVRGLPLSGFSGEGVPDVADTVLAVLPAVAWPAGGGAGA